MTSLMNLVLLLALPMQFQPNFVEPDPNLNEAYCNERFQFCSQFSQETFPTQLNFNEGDGLLLKTENDLATVIIAGYSDFQGNDTKEIFEHSVASISATGEKPTLISSLFGEDFYECFFLIGHQCFYYKTYLFEDHMVQLSIETSINQPNLMQKLREDTALFFPEDEVALPQSTLTGR